MKLSNQAVGAFMMILIRGIREQVDMTDEFKKLELVLAVGEDGEDELVVKNPPVIKLTEEEEEEE